MAFKVDANANISMIQGDSGALVIEGLNTEKNYAVYLAVQNKNREPVGSELTLNSNYSSNVIFHLTGSYTDAFTVPKGDLCAIYYYGIKICDSANNTEDTLILADGEVGDINTITVYPKKVEGV